MENKYYQPDLTEFHIGFRYEYITVEDIWVDDVFGIDHPFDTEPMGLDIIKKICKNVPDNLRTKLLNKTDIEELGFKFECNDFHPDWENVDTYILIKNNKIEDYEYDEDDNIFLHHFKTNNLIIIDDGASYEEFTYFKGTIKNYNELERILKQIGVR